MALCVDGVSASQNKIEAFTGSLARGARASLQNARFGVAHEKILVVHAGMSWHHIVQPNYPRLSHQQIAQPNHQN